MRVPETSRSLHRSRLEYPPKLSSHCHAEYPWRALVKRPSKEGFPMRFFIFSNLVALGIGLSSPALADGSAVFGGAGQLAISGDMQFAVPGQSYSAPNGQTSPGSTTSVVLAPAGAFLASQGLSVGGQLWYAHSQLTRL